MSHCNGRPVMTRGQSVIVGSISMAILAGGIAVATAGTAAAATDLLAPATAPAQTRPAGPAPKFRCDEPDYKFGEVWAMAKVEHTFVIRNEGEGELTIEARPTCGCTVAEYDKSIAPGQQGKVKTILSTGNYTTHAKKIINVTTNDPAKPNVQLSLEGDIKQPITTEPHLAAYFGQLAPGMDLTRKFKLTNGTDKPMKLELVPPATPTCFKAELKEIEPGKVAEITVTAEPPFQDNTNAAQFTIKTGMQDVPDMILPCSLIKPPPVQVVPPLVRIPPAPTANVYRQPVTVRNNSDNPLKVLSAVCNDTRIKAEQAETAPGKLWTITLEIPSGYSPEPGQSPVLTITTDYKDNPIYTVPLLSMTPPRPSTSPAFASPELMVGKAAPQLPVQLTDGRSIQIGQGGQVMLINFWASWCTTCRTQLPMLDELYQVYRRKGVEFINVAVDQYRPAADLNEIIRSLDSKIPLGTDSDQRLVKAFSVADVPAVILIGKNGIIESVRRGVGRDEKDLQAVSKALQEQLDKLLEGKDRANFAPLPIPIGSPCRLDQLPHSPLSASNGAVLGVEALRQDVGLFKPKSKGEYKLYYRNTGIAALQINAIKAATPGLTIDESYPKNLAPGTTAFVRCQFEAPAKSEMFAHQVTFNTNGATQVLNVTITGKAKPLIEVQPTSGIDFSNKARTFSVPRIATLLYNGSEQVEYKQPKSSSPKFEASIQSRQPNVAILMVKAIPPFEPGETNATITVETNQSEQPTLEIPVKLSMPKRIEVTPASIELPQGRTIQQTSVNIVNSGEKPMNILEIKKSRPEIQTQFYPEPDGLSYKLQVTVPVDFVCGPNGESITIRTDDKEYGEIVIPMRGSAGPGFARPRRTAPLRVPQQHVPTVPSNN